MTASASFLFACYPQQSPPQTPQISPPATVSSVPLQTQTASASPNPFSGYGQTLTDVAYCAPDGSPQRMDVHVPESGGPWPVLVYVHGGSWTHGDKADVGVFARLMTAEGYLVASINYRLYPVAQFPAMIQDVKCAVRFLRAHAPDYNLDPDRVGAVGVSAGGHLVSLLGTTDAGAGWDTGAYLDQSSRVQAVVALAGVMDLSRSFPNADIEAMKQIGFGEYNVTQASPISHVTPDDPPFLLIHGQLDDLVPVEQSQVMYDRLLQSNIPAQLVVVQNANHSFTAPAGETTPSPAEVHQIILGFLAQHLKGNSP